MQRGLLLVGHGTRNPDGTAQFLSLAAEIDARSPSLVVDHCFLDHADPGVQTGIDRLVARGVRDMAVVPLFLFAAGHAKVDMPGHLKEASQRHPGVSFRYGRVLGVHDSLVQVCAEHLREAERDAPVRDRRETAVLLVGRGSSDPDANADLFKVARLLWEVTRYGWVECAYSDVTAPSVPDGLQRCARLGARRIILLPYFLFKGVLMQRLQATLAAYRENSGIEALFAGAGGLSTGPGLADLLLERAAEAFYFQEYRTTAERR